MARQLDNGTYPQKVALRQHALERLAEAGIETPIILETHGGSGQLFKACYPHLHVGVVFEKDAQKAARLARQRPTWAVYECDCLTALAGGVGAHLAIDLLDVDPYGSPFEVLEAFFTSTRPFAPLMAVAVNDGLRQKVTMGGAWTVHALREAVERHGNDLHPIYLEVCGEILTEIVSHAGYRVEHFSGYYAGRGGAITHYLALLRR